MPPLPPVAFEVIIARTGTPASVPAPTPTPTLVPTPGPCLTGASCTAIGAPCSSCRSLFIARRPMPATLRRAASISPGGLFGTGTRASGTGASLLSATLAGASGFLAGGLIGSGLLLLIATAFSGGGFGRSALAFAFAASAARAWPARSAAWPSAPRPRARPSGRACRTGSHGSRRKKIAQRDEDALGDAPEARVVVRGRRPGQDARAERDAAALSLRLAVAAVIVATAVHGHPAGLGHARRPHGSNLWRTANETSLKPARAAVNITLRSRR